MRKQTFLSISMLSAFVAMACSDSGPTSPTLRALDQFVASATSDEQKAEHKGLIHQRDSVRALAKQRKRDSQALRDSMRLEWKRYKEAVQAQKKLHKRVTIELLRCAPQDYDQDAEVIGPNGGQILLGKHKLVIPRGALEKETLIVAEAPVSDLVEVRFSPHGLQFKRPATLALDYSHCFVPESFTYLIAYVSDDASKILELPPSIDKKSIKQVEGQIGHFSGYVVAW